MPVGTPEPTIAKVDLDAEDLRLGFDQLTTQYALTLVTDEFAQYEHFRQQSHDWRWNIQDALYLGWVPPKVWEGTNIPRSHLGVQIVFDQVESALPALISNVLGDNEWFQVEPEEGASIWEARGVQANLLYHLEHAAGDSGLPARNEVELATKNILIYRNGGVEISWNPATRGPRWTAVDIRDFYIDPICPTPNVDDCRSIIRRKLMTLEEVDTLRDQPGMQIPSRSVLYEMSKHSPIAVGDQTKQQAEAFRGVFFNPQQHQWHPQPSERPLEVLCRYSKNRIIWSLNRKWICYNKPNPYGFIPFAFAPCYTVPSRFYALSMADVNEQNQRYIEALMNARIDELHLAIHPPRVLKRDALMTPAQQRWRPGNIMTAVDPKNDVQVLQTQNVTANIYPEVQFLFEQSERRTGLNSLGMGVAKPGNINRTAGGVQAQQQGPANRLYYLAKNIEDYLLVPALYKAYKITEAHTTPEDRVPGIFPQQGMMPIPAAVFRKPMRFKMLGANRMLTRAKLMQIFPVASQFLLSGPVLQALGSIGKTVDFDELYRMMQDALGTGKSYNLVRALNQEEQKARQQPSPADMMKMQQAQQEAQTRLQMGQMSQQSDMAEVQASIQREMIKKQPDPMAAQLDQQKAQTQQVLMQAKMETERQKAALDMAARQQEIRLKAIEAELNRRAKIGEIVLNHQAKQSEIALNQQAQTADIMNQQQQASFERAHQQRMGEMDARNTQRAEDIKAAGELKRQQQAERAQRPRKKKGESTSSG